MDVLIARFLRLILIVAPTSVLACPPQAFGEPQAAAPVATSAGVLIIVPAPDLVPAAKEWADYRASPEGGTWKTVVFSGPSIGPKTTCRELRDRLRAAWRDHAIARKPCMILLLGDVDGDKGSIPTWSFPQTDSSMRSMGEADYVSDHPYQLMDDEDDLPDIALGRVPARTPAEARFILEKIKAHERAQASDFGPWRKRITYVAGEGHFGPMDNVLETLFKAMVSGEVPEDLDISMTYAKTTSPYCPPPDRVGECVLARLNEGSLLFNYVGHGSPCSFDSLWWGKRRVKTLYADDLSPRVAQPNEEHDPLHTRRSTIAVLVCCSTGHYDLPQGRRSLAEAMLFAGCEVATDTDSDAERDNALKIVGGGAVAVIAGSRVTHPYANAVLQKDIAHFLLKQRVKTVGELDLRATRSMIGIDATDRMLDLLARPLAQAMNWPSDTTELRAMHVRLYNLLGDPATRIALPRDAARDLRLDAGRLTGRIEGMARGTAWITLERDRMAAPEGLLDVIGLDDPDLPAKAAHNYPRANDPVLVSFQAEVLNERFSVDLPNPLPAGAAVIKVYGAGEDAGGQRFDGVGALRLTPMHMPASLNGSTSE